MIRVTGAGNTRLARNERRRGGRCWRVAYYIWTLSVVAALGVASSAWALTDDAAQPIQISARSVELNDKTGVAIYRGNVSLTQGSLRLTANRVEVTRRDNRPELIRAFGNPVTVRQRADSGDDIVISGARADYHADKKKLDLYGDVVLKRNADVVRGAVVHYDLAAQRFEAEGAHDGQVTAVIHPAAPNAP